MSSLCPVCNGLYELTAPCPTCGGLAADSGPYYNFIGPYSPYMSTESLLPYLHNESDGTSESNSFQCAHVMFCDHCDSTFQTSVNELTF